MKLLIWDLFVVDVFYIATIYHYIYKQLMLGMKWSMICWRVRESTARGWGAYWTLMLSPWGKSGMVPWGHKLVQGHFWSWSLTPMGFKSETVIVNEQDCFSSMDPVVVMLASEVRNREHAIMLFCYRINEMKNIFCKANHSILLLPYPPPPQKKLNNNINAIALLSKGSVYHYLPPMNWKCNFCWTQKSFFPRPC